MSKQKRSFFQKLTGIVHMDSEPDFDFDGNVASKEIFPKQKIEVKEEAEEELPIEQEQEGQLTVDVYQTQSDIIVKAMVAGVRGEELDITITREMITIKGSRTKERTVAEKDYFHQELYWGSFSRTIMLPHEVLPEEAEATEKHGLLTIKIPKVDKNKNMKVRVKTAQ